MARIPNEEIERLKKEIPIERLVTGFGVELARRSGRSGRSGGDPGRRSRTSAATPNHGAVTDT